jgi:hypothetical protein
MANDDTSSKSRSDVDDISLGSPRPMKQGSGPMTSFLLIVIIVAVAIFAYVMYAKKQQAAADAQAKAIAETARQAQLGQAKLNVQKAIAEAEAGNISSAIANLQAAENQLGLIISNANSEDNQQAASEALAERQVVIDARKTIEAENAKFQQAVQLQLEALRGKFGSPAATPAEGTPPSSPSPATPEATAPAPPAAEAPAAAPPAGPAAAPAPAAPVAPVAPAPVPAAPVAPPGPPAPR